jgi:predicted lipid-binding transport protein (Tim44 family)
MCVFVPILASVISFLQEIFMKRLLSLLAVVFTIGLSTVAMDAEAAKRMGSGKSMGTQRQAAQDKAPTAATPAAAGTPAAGATASPSRSWMGPVAGLAAGLGLAALASHLGFGDELASMVMMGLLAAAVMVAIGFFMRKRAAARQLGAAGPGGLQLAHVNAGMARTANQFEPDAPAYKVAMPANGGSAIGSVIGSGIGAGMGAGSSASRIPADFDSAGFERNAKVNFIRLQAANDAGDLDDIRLFTTPEMFAELKLEMTERGTAPQKTDVVSISAAVIEVDEDADRYLVSVRFTGVIRDAATTTEPDESFDEVWHLMKARQGSSGWVLSGIQQMS